MHQDYHLLPRLLLMNKDIITPAPESSSSSSSRNSSTLDRSSSTGDGINGSDDFDSNMVIILAALLCALICALGLNSIVRCVLRFSRRFASQTLPHHHLVTGSGAGGGGNNDTNTNIAAGMKKEALKQIPVVVYNYSSSSVLEDSKNIIPPAPAPASDDHDHDQCPICLAEFSQGDRVRILPGCNHGFHVNCIDTWLISHSSCPTCRRHLLSSSSSSSITI